MSCSKIRNEQTGVLYNYTNKPGLVWQDVFLPDNAPREWADRAILWNAVEAVESTKVSHLAREVILALPLETNETAWKAMLTEYIQQHFVALGMCADVSVHNSDDGHNPHAHILLTARPIMPDGQWALKMKKVYICKRNEEESPILAKHFREANKEGWQKQYRYLVGSEKVYMTEAEAEPHRYIKISHDARSFNLRHPLFDRWRTPEQLKSWRQAWAETVNRYLKATGSSARIDHRSYKERGIDLMPTIHEGSAARRIEARGGVSYRCEQNRLIRAANEQRQLNINTQMPASRLASFN